MRVVIRADASIEIGIGHIMRCLSIANELKKQGFKTTFVCRAHSGHLGERIIANGHELFLLPVNFTNTKPQFNLKDESNYSHFLGERWENDLIQTKEKLKDTIFDWLIVDHYALDARWENAMRSNTKNIMVIDDLKNRKHDCDLLLDQTFARKADEYIPLTPENCVLLTGSKYALLRPEFNSLRNESLRHRINPTIKHLLISLGGTDQFNVTSEVLKVLLTSSLPKDCKITVLMGRNAPWIDSVCKEVKNLPWKTEIKIDVNNVAKLMAGSDLVLGAAGSSAWERCCLGLPTIMLVLAENQKEIAKRLDDAKAVLLANNISDIKKYIDILNKHPEKLSNLSEVSSQITDGNGLKNVVKYMKKACA